MVAATDPRRVTSVPWLLILDDRAGLAGLTGKGAPARSGRIR